MPRSVRVAVGITGALAAAWLSAACSSSSPPSLVTSDGSSGSGTSGASSSLAGTGTGSLQTSNGSGGATGGGSGGFTNACAADVSTAQPVPLDMYLMLDTSGSMLDVTTGTTTKWDAVKAALTSFLNDGASAGLGVGLQYFPLTKPNAPTSCASNADCGDSSPCILNGCSDEKTIVPCETGSDCAGGQCSPLGQCSKDGGLICQPIGASCGRDTAGNDLGTCVKLVSSLCENTDSCDAPLYATPASPISALPGSAAGLIASIDAHTPSGATPTHAALSGAISQASAWATAHPDHRVVVLLATDGLPTECFPATATTEAAEVADVAAVAAAGVNSKPSIDTFVIGVFNSADVANGAPNNLNEIAAQGGTTTAFIVDTTEDVTKQFLSALDAIRGTHLACEFQIPQPTSNQTLDFGRVNVELTSSGQPDVVYYVASSSKCDATSGGWYYDVDPKAGTPTKIIACGASCTAFQAAKNGSTVSIALGCSTVVK